MIRMIYISSLIFPARYANQIQTLEMASAFSRLLGDAFLFVCPRSKCEELKFIPHYGISVGILSYFPNLLVYCLFLFLPIFLIVQDYGRSKVVLYFKDTRLAAFALFWRCVLFREIRVVVEAHIPFPSVYERYAFGYADVVVTITQAMAEILRDKYDVPVDKIAVCPDGVDLQSFDIGISSRQARNTLGLPPDKHIVLYCGSVGYYQWKGEDIFIDAANHFGDKFLFVMVGGCRKDAEIAYGDNSPSNVKCVGRQPHAEIPLYLKAADVLVLPNKKGYPQSETLASPLKLFEYMASGVPIVASNLQSIREVLNENNAVLIEPNNSMALATGIARLVDNEVLARRLAIRARIEVEKYQWKKRAKAIIRVLDIYRATSQLDVNMLQ